MEKLPKSDIAFLYSKISEFSFIKIAEEKIFAEYQNLIEYAKIFLMEAEFLAVKNLHLENIQSLLWSKIENEKPDFSSQIRQIVKEIFDMNYSDFEQELNKIYEKNKESDQNLLILNNSEKFIQEITLKIKEIILCELPFPLIIEIKRKLENQIQITKTQFLSDQKRKIELGINEEQWKFICEYFIKARIISEKPLLSDISEIPKNLFILFYKLLIKTISKQKAFSKYLSSRISNIVKNFDITNLESSEISNKIQEKSIDLKNTNILNEFCAFCEKFNKDLLFKLALSIFIGISPYFHESKIQNSEYFPIDRIILRKVLNKFKKHLSKNIISQYFSWKNYVLFESILSQNMLQKGVFIKLPFENTNSFIDILDYIYKNIPPEELISILGEESYNYLMFNSVEFSKCFKLMCMTPNRKTPTILICISGFLSEQDISIEQWQGAIESITEECLISYCWPSKTKFSLGKCLIPSLINFAKIKTGENLADAIKCLHSSVFEHFKDATKSAKISGKLLALILYLRFPFGYNSVINLLGFSLGTKVIAQCIKTLHKLNAFNIIGDVFLLGGAASYRNEKSWEKIIPQVVAGRVINCYSKNDWVLQALHHSQGKDPIGTRPIFIKSEKKRLVENYDVTDTAGGHMNYRSVLSMLFKQFYF